MQAADYFKRIPLFSDLGADEIQDVLRIARLSRFSPGQHLCTTGQKADCAFVIDDGEAVVRVRDDAQQDVEIARVGPGEVVGELALLDGHPRSADVIALTEVRAYRLDRAELDVLRRQLHPAAFKIVRRIAITVSDRLRDVNDAIAAALAQSAGKAPRRSTPGASLAPPPSRPGDRASRAGQRAARDIERASLPPPAARSTPASRSGPSTLDGAARKSRGASPAQVRVSRGAAPSPEDRSSLPSAQARPSRGSGASAPARPSRAQNPVRPSRATATAQSSQPEQPSLWGSMLARLRGQPWK